MLFYVFQHIFHENLCEMIVFFDYLIWINQKIVIFAPNEIIHGDILKTVYFYKNLINTYVYTARS